MTNIAMASSMLSGGLSLRLVNKPRSHVAESARCPRANPLRVGLLAEASRQIGPD